MTEQIIPQKQIDKSEHRESSRLRNQPRKNYKVFIPQSKILKKVEFQKTTLNSTFKNLCTSETFHTFIFQNNMLINTQRF